MRSAVESKTKGNAMKKSKKSKLADRVSQINANKKAAKVKKAKAPAKVKEIVGVGMGREVVVPPVVDTPAPGTVILRSEMSGLDAAAKVLGEAGASLNCPAIVKAIFAAGYWQSNGKTPAATIHTAIITEIKKKGDASRFVKTGRGLFSVRQ